MPTKNRYMIDEKNRLIIKRNQKSLSPQGRFSVDKANRLTYWLNEPSHWRRTYNLPNKVAFEGNWQLNENYDLQFNLTQKKDQSKDDCLVFKGEIFSVDRDTLAFEINSRDEEVQSHIRTLKLTGSWQADQLNRIIFLVSKKGSPDTIALKGAWQINQNQQIAYTYEKTLLKRKTKVSHTLTFTGFWQIDSKNQLTYILEHSLKSRFDFRVQLESPNLYPKAGAIKYRIGIGLKQKGVQEAKIIYLYGDWKFNRKLGLTYEMDCGEGRIERIEFGANIYLSKEDEVTFSLTNKRNEPLGINITLTHKFLKQNDAEAFLRLKKICRETGIEAGVRIPF